MVETVIDFFLERGRLPRIGDEVPPWRYKGWLLPYIQGHEAELCGRWPYYLETVYNGQLPDTPIPKLTFAHIINQKSPGFKMAWKLAEAIEYKSGFFTGFRELINWLGWATGTTTESSELPDDIQEELYRGFDARLWLAEPHDYLGEMMAERRSGSRWNNPNAFFPTPHNVVEMMTQMTFDGGNDNRAKTVCDPAVGSGRMLLHAAGQSLRLFGMDIDPLCVAITKINGAFFAPWLAFGTPDSLFAEPAPTERSLKEVAIERYGREVEPVFLNSGQGLLFGSAEDFTRRK